MYHARSRIPFPTSQNSPALPETEALPEAVAELPEAEAVANLNPALAAIPNPALGAAWSGAAANVELGCGAHAVGVACLVAAAALACVVVTDVEVDSDAHAVRDPRSESGVMADAGGHASGSETEDDGGPLWRSCITCASSSSACARAAVA